MDLIDRQALLKQIDIDSDGEPGYYGDTWKFIDTIKKMPSAVDVPDTNIGKMELINKQTAIDTILGQPPEPHYPSWYAEQIKALPSVQLGTNLAQDGTDLISRQAVMLRVREFITNPSYTEELLVGELNGLPPEQSEIIYCKDCKHWIPYDWMFREVWQSKNIADYPEDEIGCNWCEAAMKANDFCSHAERRQDG